LEGGPITRKKLSRSGDRYLRTVKPSKSKLKLHPGPEPGRTLQGLRVRKSTY